MKIFTIMTQWRLQKLFSGWLLRNLNYKKILDSKLLLVDKKFILVVTSIKINNNLPSKICRKNIVNVALFKY